jgi:hypothetical protein
MKTCKHCGKEYDITLKTFYTCSPSYCSIECRTAVRQQVNKTNKERAKLKLQQGVDIEWILKRKHSNYKHSAKERGYEYTLTIEVLKSYYKKECYYCNDVVNDISLDRINNTKGYTPDNIISCCIKCNIMKHTQTQKEFIDRCKTISLLHADK